MEGGCCKKLIKSKSGLKIVVTNDEYRSPFLLCEPQWIPDSESTSCTECKAKFDFITRRHHCRRCGQIYCGSCCDTKMGLPRMCFVDPVRVCNRCALVTNEESNFFDRQLKTLTSGATFILDQRLSPSSDSVSYLVCKLSQDHRYLIFEGKAADSVTSVELHQVKTLGVARDPDAGTELYFEYIVDFKPQICALSNLSVSIIGSFSLKASFHIHMQVYLVS